MAIVIAHVGHRLQALDSQQVLGPLGHGAEVGAVGRIIGDFMVEDELVLGVDGDLDVIGHVGAMAFAGGHGSAIWVGEGDLRLARLLHVVLQTLGLLHALSKLLDLLFELLGGERRLFRLLGVVGIQLVQVGFDLPWPGQDRLVDVFDRLLQLAVGEVALPAAPCRDGIDGFELGPVDGHEIPAEEVQVPAESGEGAADLLDGFAVVPAEVGDGLACPG